MKPGIATIGQSRPGILYFFLVGILKGKGAWKQLKKKWIMARRGLMNSDTSERVDRFVEHLSLGLCLLGVLFRFSKRLEALSLLSALGTL